MFGFGIQPLGGAKFALGETGIEDADTPTTDTSKNLLLLGVG